MRFVRWAAVVPISIGSWYLALIIGLAVRALVESLCPEEQMVSGMCTANWFLTAEKFMFCCGAALSAFFVVASASFVAPAEKSLVSCVALAAGSAVAPLFAVQAHAWAEFVSAIAAGALAVFGVRAVVAQPKIQADVHASASLQRGTSPRFRSTP